MVPRRAEGLSMGAKNLLGELLSQANGFNDSPMSRKDFAELLECTERSIQNWFEELVQNDFLKIIGTKMGRIKGKYELTERAFKPFSTGKILPSRKRTGKIFLSNWERSSQSAPVSLYKKKIYITASGEDLPCGEVSPPAGPTDNSVGSVIPQKQEEDTTDSPFASGAAIEELKKLENPLYKRIIGWFMDSRDLVVPTKEEFNKIFKKHLVFAHDIAAYEKSHGLDHVLAAFDKVEGMDFKWRKGVNDVWTLKDVLDLLRAGWKS